VIKKNGSLNSQILTALRDFVSLQKLPKRSFLLAVTKTFL